MVWGNLSCAYYKKYHQGLHDINLVLSYGQRCRGRNQECIYPWYTSFDGNRYDSSFLIPRYNYRKIYGLTTEQCSDKSDEIFTIGLTCRAHLEEHVKFHTEHFCNSSVWTTVQTDLICKNKTEWLSKSSRKIFQDPHNCQSSCNSSGLDCTACTNKNYFKCTKSGQCVHPELECDGHPQCTFGEDEELTRCHKKYIENKIVERYASYRCKSIFYEDMDIYATPCNKIRECFDGSDEVNCKEDITTTYILLGTSFLLIALYISLKVYQYNTEDKTDDFFMFSSIDYPPVESYEERHDDPDIIREALETVYICDMNRGKLKSRLALDWDKPVKCFLLVTLKDCNLEIRTSLMDFFSN